MNRDISNKVTLGILLPFFAIIGLLLLNKTAVQDWWHRARYNPETKIQLLADSADMSDLGEQLFFRADPELVSKARADKLCLAADNLGCLVSGPKIYVLEYQDESSPEFYQSVVTGAHEMLHMVYFRLSEEERVDVNSMIDQALSLRVKDSRIINVLDKTSDEHEYYDEAHALLGSEVNFLPLDLEAHYLKYFDDRDDVLKAFDRSEVLLR